MAKPERLHLAPSAGGELSLRLQRELWKVVSEHWPDDLDKDDVDVIALGNAVAQFAFDHELLYVPDDPKLRAEGVRFYPVTPHQIKPVWIVQPAPAPRGAPAPPARPTSLRDLGAEPIDERRSA